MSTDMSEYVRVGEAVRLLRLSEKTVHKLFDRGDLPGFRLPTSKRERRIHRPSMEALMEKLGIPNPNPEATERP